MKGAGTPRDSAGRFESHTRCEFCAKPIRGDYWSDPDLDSLGGLGQYLCRGAGRVSDYPWRYASGCPRWHRWPATEHGNGPPPPPDPDAPTEDRDGFALRFRDFVR